MRPEDPLVGLRKKGLPANGNANVKITRKEVTCKP